MMMMMDGDDDDVDGVCGACHQVWNWAAAGGPELLATTTASSSEVIHRHNPIIPTYTD
jgi:hypothetical protein